MSANVTSSDNLKMKSLDLLYGEGPDAVSEDGFDVLGVYHGEPIKNVYKSITKLIDETPFEPLIFKPQKEMQDFKAFFSSKIPTKAFFVFMNTWPSAVPPLVPTIDPTMKLLVKMTSVSSCPEKFLGWVAAVLLPRHWSEDVAKGRLLAATLCESKVGKPTVWAMLNDESHVIIVEEDEKTGEFQTVFEDKGFRASVSDRTVKILDQNAEEVTSFVPCDTQTAQLWVSLFDAKKPSFFQFLTSTNYSKIPIEVTLSINNYFTHLNMNAVRALLVPDVVLPDQLENVFYNLFNIAAYSQKVTLMNHAILTAIFEQPTSTVKGLTRTDSPLHVFYNLYVKQFASPYFINFAKKLVAYINSKSPISLSDEKSKEIAKIFVTTLKYILSSIQFYPPELQHLSSMVQAYCNLKFNSKAATYTILTDLFIDNVLCCFLDEPEKYNKPIVVDNQKSLSFISDLIKIAFHMKPIGEKYPALAFLDKYLKKKYHLLMETFIFETTVLYRVEDEIVCHTAPSYSSPDYSVLLKCCESLVKIISRFSFRFNAVYQYFHDPNMFATSSLGWAVSETIMEYFKYENEDQREINEKLQQPCINESYFSELSARLCVGPLENQIPKISEQIPSKVYKRVKRTTKSFIKGAESPDDQLVEQKVVSEIVNPDGTKKTVIKKTVHRRKSAVSEIPDQKSEENSNLNQSDEGQSESSSD